MTGSLQPAHAYRPHSAAIRPDFPCSTRFPHPPKWACHSAGPPWISKNQVADVGRFFNKKGQEVVYRSILLPLSDDGLRVNRVVSAFSYKVVH